MGWKKDEEGEEGDGGGERGEGKREREREGGRHDTVCVRGVCVKKENS